MQDRRHLRQKLGGRIALAALAAFMGTAPSAAAPGTVVLRCTTGPGELIEPVVAELPAREALLILVSGNEWQEWSPDSSGWSVDLCARAQTRCHVSELRLVRFAEFAGQDQTVSLERSIDRRTGSYRMRITTSGRNPQIVQWDGACQMLAKGEPPPRPY